MTQPLLTKQSFLVALLTLAQGVMPPVIAVGALYLTMMYFGGVFELSSPPSIIVGVVCWLMFQPTRRARTLPTRGRMSAIMDVLVKWLLMMALLTVIDHVMADSPFREYPNAIETTWAVTTLAALLAGTLTLRELRRRMVMDAFESRSAIIAGYNNSALKLSRRLKRNRGMRLEVAGFFDDRMDEHLEVESDVKILGNLNDLGAYVKTHRIDVIFVALPNREVQRVMNLMDDLRDTTASIYYVPDSIAVDRIEPRSVQIQGMPVIAIGETPFYGYRGVGKRLTDVGLAMLALVLFSPLILVMMALIKLSSPGPLIYKQRRYGLDGREVNLYRFRTRTIDDGSETRIGALLHHSSLDKLPQLVNVLQGKMSLVGPQPYAVNHSEEYRKLIKGYMVRHKVLPGVTGLAQVSHSDGDIQNLRDLQARVDFDLEYLRQWTPLLDIKILMRAAFRITRQAATYRRRSITATSTEALTIE